MGCFNYNGIARNIIVNSLTHIGLGFMLVGEGAFYIHQLIPVLLRFPSFLCLSCVPGVSFITLPGILTAAAAVAVVCVLCTTVTVLL